MSKTVEKIESGFQVAIASAIKNFCSFTSFNSEYDEPKETGIWGYSLHLNLAGCNPEKIRDGEFLKKFFLDLCAHIKMTPYGEPQVIYFGKDPFVSGYSVNLFLEESNITGHFVEQTNRVFIDVFSCCEFSSKDAFSYVKEAFDAESGNYKFLVRSA